MSADGMFNQHLDVAVKHYSKLFWLPSLKKVLLSLVLVCVCGSLLLANTFLNIFDGLINGAILGLSLICVSLICDYAISAFVLKQDPIYDLRRTMAFSLFCWLLWFLFIFIGIFVAKLFGSSWWLRLCLLGFSAVLIFRLIVLNATSSTNYKRILTASFIQPFPCVIVFMVFWSVVQNITHSAILFLFYSSVIGLLSVFFFTFILNRAGERMLGFPSLSIFKAFLLNWVMNLNAPFEAFLEKLGEERDVEVSLIKFDYSRPKAVIAVPSVHPGPFKNVGSSLLPSMLKTSLEQHLNTVACVPHSLFGHELDLASQTQNKRIIDYAVESVDFKTSETKATPFIKLSNGLATACCQIFGKSVFIGFTLAPETTEDFPQELGLFVNREAEKYRLTGCVIVNEHNSINGVINAERALNALKAVAAECLEKAAYLKRLPFRAGAATVMPKEFSLKDGMGPGGITVIVVEVGEQKTAYVVIDGNNMVSGLREKILSALKLIGISEGEVFTTDTHSVNALTLNKRGYHPVGEAIDHEKLIDYIKKATQTALVDLEPVKTAHRSITIPKVKVIGKKSLEELCLLTDKILQKAKNISVPLFTVDFLLLMLFLLFV